MNTNLYVPTIVRKLFVHETVPSLALTEVLKQEIVKVARNFTATATPQSILSFNGRLERGLELALSGAVQPTPTREKPNLCRVISSDRFHSYLVDIEARHCDCPDSSKGNYCKHRIAVYYLIQDTINLNKAAQSVQQPKTPVVQQTEKPHVQIPAAKPIVAPKTKSQILKELGFQDDTPKKVTETITTQSGFRLGSLYRKYLHGLDLDQKPVKVTITNITKETVTPHPGQPSFEKYCLWVSGLPVGTPNGILFGAQGDRELAAIFGRAEIDSLRGKAIVIYPQAVTVAGQPRIAIHFRGA